MNFTVNFNVKDPREGPSFSERLIRYQLGHSNEQGKMWKCACATNVRRNIRIYARFPWGLWHGPLLLISLFHFLSLFQIFAFENFVRAKIKPKIIEEFQR